MVKASVDGKSTSNAIVDATKHAFYLRLAVMFDKPFEYVERACNFFNVFELPKFRTPDDGLNEFYSAMTGFYDTAPSRTKQEFTEECDINYIMKRFINSGYDPTVLPLPSRPGRYGDFTDMPDSYHAALNYVADTKSEFMKLPAELRSRFDNDPQLFLNFVMDPANSDELIRLGLAEAAVATQTAKAATAAQVGSSPSPEPSNAD